MERPTCVTCPFWDDACEVCQRFPPVVIPTSTYADTGNTNEHWPSTRAGDWCGEHPQFDAYIKATAEAVRA